LKAELLPSGSERSSHLFALILGLLIGTGLAVGGLFVGNGFEAGRRGERFVTVKGLAQRDVRADLAVWTISYTATGAKLADANAAGERAQTIILEFAHRRDFRDSEIEIQPATATDALANQFRTREVNPAARYVIEGAVKLRSNNVDRISKTSQATGALVSQGVVLGENYPQAPQYFYTSLNDIRPAMLAEATRSARAVAEQFAADSKSRLGPIRRASQGVFEISSRDATGDRGPMDDQSSLEKKVRLVSTIDYYLLDR
jgi:hypothetical protein